MGNERTMELVRELTEVLRKANDNADIMCLPSESQAMATQYHEDAVRIIEELTGCKWEFTWLTWF